RSNRRVQSAADDEAEIPRTLRCHEPGISRCGQLLDHLQRRRRAVLEANPQRRAQLLKRSLRPDRALWQRPQILGRDLSGTAQQWRIHPSTLLSPEAEGSVLLSDG